MTKRAEIILNILREEIALKRSQSEYRPGEIIIDLSSMIKAANRIDEAISLAEAMKVPAAAE